jgi:hypothetical protein
MQPKESKSNWHFKISIAKSILRIGAGGALFQQYFVAAGTLFVLAEILGIIEEI